MTEPLMPTLAELLHPQTQPDHIVEATTSSTDELDPIHLFDMSWRQRDGHISHRVLPPELTGVEAPIVVISGRHFPTGSHKVGPGYSCLREKLLDGKIRRDGSTLVFPSTGNYGIGGAWVGPRMGFDSLVVLPMEMSAERFEKIRAYGAEVIATPGCESNVKEIYDKVKELRQDPNNQILNQFEDFGNFRFHYHVTGGSAVELADELAGQGIGDGSIAAFVSAMGSAGTIAAAERIQLDSPRCKTVGLEPVQCPTLYSVGYGGHGIEGIGDKHVTWIHNVRNLDMMMCIDEYDALKGVQLLQEGRDVLAAELGIDQATLDSWDGVFGISGACNIIGAIKTARHYGFGPKEVVMTVATDGFDRYPSVMRRLDSTHGPMDYAEAKRRIDIFRNPDSQYVLEGTVDVRRRWHNQKYFTWVEQQGKSIEALNALWDRDFWREQAELAADYDRRTLETRA